MWSRSNPVLIQDRWPLVPAPVEVKNLTGTFQFSSKTRINISSGDNEVRKIAELFSGQLASLTGKSLKVSTRSEKQSIRLELNKEDDICIGNEGYTLHISPQNITIEANKPAGLFYGIQTLLQFIPPVKQQGLVEIPCVDIVDYPRFKWRGLMLDVSRYFFTKDEVKRYIDQMSKYKYNVFHWHLTDDPGWRMEIKRYPRLTEIGAWRVPRIGLFYRFPPPEPDEISSYGGYYTQDDIKEVVRYASDRYITIVPEIDIPGHSKALIAAYPETSCNGAQGTVYAGETGGPGENVLCTGNEKNFEMLDHILDEVVSLFPGEYIHIGGDEVNKEFWKNCLKCQELKKKHRLKDEHELQSYFIKRVEKIIESKGKRLIGWDEIMEGGLAPNATVMSWRGTDGGIKAAKAGHKVIMTPTNFCYLDYMQGEPAIERHGGGYLRANTVYQFEPIPESIDPAYILGGQGNIWTEMISNYRKVEYMTWPRALALSEVLWSPSAKRNWNNFVPRMEAQFDRFDQDKVNYATSIYDPEISIMKDAKGNSQIVFTTEIHGLDIYYTFDFTFPDKFSMKYTDNPIRIPKGATEIWAITYRDGKPVGRLLTIHIEQIKLQE